MDYVNLKKGALIERYGDWLDEAKGGIFSRNGREKLLGIKRLPAEGGPRNDFWQYAGRRHLRLVVLAPKPHRGDSCPFFRRFGIARLSGVARLNAARHPRR